MILRILSILIYKKNIDKNELGDKESDKILRKSFQENGKK